MLLRRHLISLVEVDGGKETHLDSFRVLHINLSWLQVSSKPFAVNFTVVSHDEENS